MSDAPKKPYELTAADVRFLRSLRIAPFEDLGIWKDGQRIELPKPRPDGKDLT